MSVVSLRGEAWRQSRGCCIKHSEEDDVRRADGQIPGIRDIKADERRRADQFVRRTVEDLSLMKPDKVLHARNVDRIMRVSARPECEESSFFRRIEQSDGLPAHFFY